MVGGRHTPVLLVFDGGRTCLAPRPLARCLDKCLEICGVDAPSAANFETWQFTGAEPVLDRFRAQLEDGGSLFCCE
jgi:hypothetical protein